MSLIKLSRNPWTKCWCSKFLMQALDRNTHQRFGSYQGCHEVHPTVSAAPGSFGGVLAGNEAQAAARQAKPSQSGGAEGIWCYQKCSCCLNGFRHLDVVLRCEILGAPVRKANSQFSFRSPAPEGQTVATMAPK